MKNLTKIFVAVAVLLAGFACTTDVTEDLGVSINNQAEITLSLEEARTHINGKVDGEYPLYWSEGDKIAVNGVASTPLSEADHGKASATFTISGVAYPYNIVYPAPAEGVTAADGLQAVTFPAAQAYTAGTFAEGAAPMYAYVAKEGDAVSLKHLAGVLCIAPKGEGVVLTSLTVTAENGKIAGNFDVDCTTGDLTAHDDALNTVTVTFGEGLTLGAEATPIYVAVPAGEYGVFSVTLNSTAGKMAVHFDSTSNPIKAGTVREFAPFVYTTNVAEGEEFLIDSADALIRFAKIASNFAPYKSAKVVANIDMTGEAWTPIEGFAHAFDGGNFEIKGLNAPLFGTITATEIKNVKLVDVNILAVGSKEVGSIACKIDNTAAVVSNCSASGKMVLQNNGALSSAIYSAGLIARSTSTQTFSNLTNEIDIEVSGEFSVENTYVCGCVGYAKDLTVENLTNLGNLTFKDIVSPRACLCGVAGYTKVYKNCVNGVKGDATKGCLKYEGTKNASFWAGGIGGVSDATRTLTNCINYGSIIVTENASAAGVIVGGIYANCQSSKESVIYTFDGCANHGKLSIKPASTNGNVKVGGGWAQTTGSYNTFKILNGFTNTGDITVEIDNVAGGTVLVGGAVSTFNKGLHADSNGVIKNEGNITYKGVTSTASYTRISGVLAHTGTAPLASANLSYVNTGDITAIGQFGTTGYVGGVMGTGRDISNARSFCNIKAIGATYVATIFATSDTKYKATNSHSGGTICVDESAGKIDLSFNNWYNYISAYDMTYDAAKSANCGYISSIDAIPAFGAPHEINSAEALLAFAESAATTTADISITADIDMTGMSWTSIEGYVGNVYGNGNKIKGLTAPLFGTISGSILDLHLTDVNIEVTDIKAEYGALAGKIDSSDAVVRNCSASGKMKINLAMSEAITGNGSNKDIDIAGLVGYTTSTCEFSNLTNEVDIEIAGTYKNNIVATGIITAGVNCSLSNSKNLGKITYTATSNSNVFMGGLVHECKSVTDCVNGSAEDKTFSKGALTIDGTTRNAYASGFTPSGRSDITLTRCHNYGAITYTENAVTGGTTLPAGAVGYYSPSTAVLVLDACANHAPISVNNSTIGGDLKVGGIIGHYGGSNLLTIRNGYTNTGDFNISPKSVAAGKSVQIGGMVGNFSATWTTESTGGVYNSGNITYGGASSSTSTVRVGGITAAMAKDIPAIKGFEIINTGDIKSTGTGKAVYVGGILGAGKLVDGAKCHCKIYATSGTTIGWIMPAARTSTLKATNCQIGGNTVEIDDSDESELLSPITAEDYFNLIYSTPIDKEVAEADGCSHLSVKPTIR